MVSSKNAREKILHLASKRILILDGAMGSLIAGSKSQAPGAGPDQPLTEDDFRGLTGSGAAGNRFRNHPVPVKGCNDLLCLTMPGLISGIHEAYLKAGADIIETNTFNATPVSLAGYGLADAAYEISAAAARLAREAADRYSTPDKPRFVAGSMGPTSKSLTLPPDINDPGKRSAVWDDIAAAYYQNAKGLIDGGADILIIETIFDTLNAKAAIFASGKLAEERGIDIPLVISATISDNGGRLLSGQTVEAFCVSILHADPLAVGLNCSFGAEKLKPYIAEISAMVPCLVSAHPNAGLPNRQGEYDESPESMADHVEEYFRKGIVNITGGCCGSRPEHIARIAERALNYVPRPLPEVPKKTLLSGLEVLEINRDRGLANAGECTNVAGSRKFRRAVAGNDYEEAADIARDMAEAGAVLMDVCMDDAHLDAKPAMTEFLNTALQFPDLARFPVIIDSSSWDVIEAGLKCLQGKGLVNSISLKDGEAEFLRRARAARSYGAAAIVMLFDEEGQAVSYERKIAVAERSWKLLMDSHFPPADVFFDPVILALAADFSGQDASAVDFLNACDWIRDNCPGAQICGGISNLSFSFRSNNRIREALHSAFIKHAVMHGLTVAIVNPAALVPYDNINRDLRSIAEDLILNRTSKLFTPSPSGLNTKNNIEQFIAMIEKYLPGTNHGDDNGGDENDSAWRSLSVEERIIHAMINGIDDFIAEDIEELKELYWRPLEIVRGPLMRGMKIVGERFREGRLFLPQIIRAARVMKKAMAVLEQSLKKGEYETCQTQASTKVLLATVKGDIHNTGKDIIAMVLSCNGFEIIDMGVMVPADRIIEKAKAEKADVIGLSGLITSSLDEMILVAREMNRQGLTIPLIIGGAAASLAHTALHIAPEYSGRVVYVPDAGQAPGVVRSLVSKSESPTFMEEMQKVYAGAVEHHNFIQTRRNILSLEEARKNKVNLSWSVFRPGNGVLDLPAIFDVPAEPGSSIVFDDYPLSRVMPCINWISFVKTWDLAVNTYPSAYNKVSREEAQRALDKLLEDAKVLLNRIVDDHILCLRGVVGFFSAYSDGDDVVLPAEGQRFCFPRNQERKTGGMPNPCLADFIVPRDLYGGEAGLSGKLGLFALSAGFGLKEAEGKYRLQNDDYSALLLTGLANTLAEAFSEEVRLRLFAAFGSMLSETRAADPMPPSCGISPVFGYPACPDHRDKEIAFRLLGAKERCGLDLTETAMIIPAASVCGMYIAHPDSCYFGTGIMTDEQLHNLASRKGISFEEAAGRIGIC